MSEEVGRKSPYEILLAAISTGDANTVLLHTAENRLSVQDFNRAMAEIAFAKAEEYDDAAVKVGSGRASGYEHNGKHVDLVWDNSFERKRAEKLRTLARELLNASRRP